jgi:hypothetical protein
MTVKIISPKPVIITEEAPPVRLGVPDVLLNAWSAFLQDVKNVVHPRPKVIEIPPPPPDWTQEKIDLLLP